MTFHVGQKVVCVDNQADPGRRWISNIQPEMGRVYTVSRFSSERTYHDHGLLSLVELGTRCLYRASRFRPLTDQKKSVSFTMGADPDSERWDNRRKVVEPVNALINASNAVSDRFDRRAVQVQGGVGR